METGLSWYYFTRPDFHSCPAHLHNTAQKLGDSIKGGGTHLYAELLMYVYGNAPWMGCIFRIGVSTKLVVLSGTLVWCKCFRCLQKRQERTLGKQRNVSNKWGQETTRIIIICILILDAIIIALQPLLRIPIFYLQFMAFPISFSCWWNHSLN